MELEVWKLIAQFMTPLVVLFIGLKISHILEKHKTELSINKEWRSKWAELFYSSSVKFNVEVQNFISSSYELVRFRGAGLLTDDLASRFWKERTNAFLEIQKTEYSIRILVDLAPSSKIELMMAVKEITNSVDEFVKTDFADADAFVLLLSRFNAIAKTAHNEILAGV